VAGCANDCSACRTASPPRSTGAAREWAGALRSPGQAERALQELSGAGDRLWERAVLAVMWDRFAQVTAATGWGPLLQRYLDANPSLLPDFDRLAGLESQASRTDRLLTRLATVPMRPSELRNRRPLDAQRSA
jgi:hypothetical protein